MQIYMIMNQELNKKIWLNLTVMKVTMRELLITVEILKALKFQYFYMKERINQVGIKYLCVQKNM